MVFEFYATVKYYWYSAVFTELHGAKYSCAEDVHVHGPFLHHGSISLQQILGVWTCVFPVFVGGCPC